MRAAGPVEERDRKSGPPISPGDTLLGKYRVERVLGEGSMGTIFAARNVEQGHLVALKILTAKALASSQATPRFLREARALARLRGPHVAEVHEVVRLPSGAPCMVMEYLRGADLQAILKERPVQPIAQALDWVIQACEGVAEAHALDIVHRDIKPANLFVSPLPDGRSQVRVLDFGIAKLVERDGPFDHELTQVGMVFGTPSYMSPEQMRQTKDVDARTDIWSLGVVLYEMLTGALPFSAAAGPMDLALRVSVEAPPRPIDLRPDLPPSLEAVVMCCLEKKPERRYQTAAQLADALRSVLAALPDDRGSLLPSPPAADRGSLAPVPPVSVRGAPAAQGVPAPARLPGAPVSGPVSAGSPAGKGSFPRWLLGVVAAVILLVVAVPAIVLSGRDPGAPVASAAQTASAATSPVLTAQPVIHPTQNASGSATAAETASSTVPAPSSAPSSTAPSPGAAVSRPTSTARPSKPASFNACFTSADCRRGKRCVQGWCK